MCYPLVIREAGKEMHFTTSVDGGMVFSKKKSYQILVPIFIAESKLEMKIALFYPDEKLF